MQASRCDAGTATKIQQAQMRGAVEQAAQGLIADKAAGAASKAELLKAGEAWARSPYSPGRLGQPHQVQQPQHLQLGAALLQSLNRQLERSAVAIDAGAHLQDLELGATAAQQRTQDGCCLGAVGQPQFAHSGPCLLQEVHHGCGLHHGVLYIQAVELGAGFG